MPPLVALAAFAYCTGCQAPALRPLPAQLIAADISLDEPPSQPSETGDEAPTPTPAFPDPAAGSLKSASDRPGAQHAPLMLTLAQAVELALAQNPDLVALRQNEGVSLGMLGVAATYPFNPSVQVQELPSPLAADGTRGQNTHYVLLMQTLQMAHQQRHREAAARASLASVRWNIVQAEVQAAATTQRLFFTAQYQQGLRDLIEANARLNDQVLTIAEKQLAAGQIAAADVAIARLDQQATRQQARLAEANYRTAVLDLHRQLNVPVSCPLSLVGSLADWQWSPVSGAALAWMNLCAPVDPLQLAEPSDLAATLAGGRPDVLAAEADLGSAQANLNLSHANRVPDLQIGPYYAQNEGGTTFWGFRAQADIPLLNTGQPLVRQRLAEVHQRHAAWRQLHERATREAETALDRYERARQLAGDAPRDLAGEVPIELAKLEQQFLASEVDVVRLITARTSLLAARRAQLDSLNELAQSAAALAAATALPPQALLASEK